MGHIFGKPKKKAPPKVTEQDKAILQLKQQRDKLKQYQKRINDQIERERQIARELIKNNKKEKALLLLRKKRFMEEMIQKTDNQLMNLERMTHDIEFGMMQNMVMEGLQKGNDALKQLHSILSIEQIEDILEETSEGISKQREIDHLLLGAFTDDEEDYTAELEIILGEDKVPELPVPELPKVPQHEPVEIVKERVSENPTKEPLLAS